MSRWSRIALIVIIVLQSLFCVHFLHLKGRNTRYNLSKLGSKESPSLFAPLVITMCESSDAALEEGENMTDIISKADNSSDAAFKLRGSWIRQRDQVTTLLKTLLLFSKSPLWRIIVLTDNHNTFDKIVKIADGFPSRERGRLLLERRDQWYPPAHPELRDDWRPCAWAKQFLAEALPDEDAVVYVDTDVVFLGPAETMWSLFGSLDPQELIALSVEPQYLFDEPKRFHAGSIGLNTGVMVTNLTRQRQLPGGSLGSAMIQAGLLNTRYLYRHDQDALNHYLKKKPHLFLEISPRWNFIVGACNRKAPYCEDCVTYGIVVLHGADATFYRPIDRKFLVRSLTISRDFSLVCFLYLFKIIDVL